MEKEKILVVINGESNSGGYALNTEAPPEETGIRGSVRILNNLTLESFDVLNIGVNNLVDHTGLPDCPTHGFELELANRADVSPFYSKPCFLVKTGQGGSLISQWETGGQYFTTFVKRISAAKKLLADEKYKTVVLFSLGINDALAGTDIGIWKAAVKAHLGNLRKELGENTPIIMTKFMPYFSEYSDAIAQICGEISDTYAVYTEDATQRDRHHWDYRGMKLIAGRMLDIFESLGK